MSKKNFYDFYEAKEAARRLGVTGYLDYVERYHMDVRLPRSPRLMYAKTGWSGWKDFLGKTIWYQTYEEAKSAAKKLGIKNGSQYKNLYKEDPRLPSTPNYVYSKSGWKDWYDFCDRKKPDYYANYAEAETAAQALGISGWNEYKMRYRENPKLPPLPFTLYKTKGWIDWYVFCGKERPNYYSYIEAKSAVVLLGIERVPDYDSRFKEDPRLPARPDLIYRKEWKTWYEFFGRERRYLYPTFAEAQAAAQAFGFKSENDYKLNLSLDNRLPSSPANFYSGKGWAGWNDFLGKESIFPAEQKYPIIWSELLRWLSASRGIAQKRNGVRTFLSGYYNINDFPDDPLYLLRRSANFDVASYKEFICSQSGYSKIAVHTSIAAFYAWLLNEHCRDPDTVASLVLPEYRDPFAIFLKGFVDTLEILKPKESTKIPLGYEYILRARQFLVPNGEQAAQLQPSLSDLHHLHEFFGTRSDWVPIDQSRLDLTDPNCVWREVVRRHKKDVIFQIWSPVRFIALYVLLRFPLRGQQILWLDSGEADTDVAVLDSFGGVKWKKNQGPLAGQHRNAQAAVQRGHLEQPKFYVTTNKTAAIEGGYEIPWVPDDLVYWLTVLRNWQSKYNPIRTPTPWTKIGLERLTNPKVLEARGTQCFLFRSDSSGVPISTSTAFSSTLPALLYEIQRPGENLASKDPTLTVRFRYESPYTPHCLRVSLITAFMVDGGAPLSVVSKLVGHSSLVMTVYYIRLNNEQMRRAITEAEKRALKLAMDSDAAKVREGGVASLRDRLIVTDANNYLFEEKLPGSACVVFDHGICPRSASACEEGGYEILSRPNAANVHAAVEVGYLGKKNCIRCRFFITGVPFLGGLVSLGNEISLEIHVESKRYQEFTIELEFLERDYYDSCVAGRADHRLQERKQASANQQLSASKLDCLLSDYVAVNRYVQDCITLANEISPGDAGIRLVLAEEREGATVIFEESKSSYHLLAEICQNATIYSSANSSRAVPLVSQAIDRMVENSGLAPAMFRLSEEQKITTANELSHLLLHRLGSWEKIDNLFCGDLSLLDVDGLEPNLTKVSIQVRNLLEAKSDKRQISGEIEL